MTVIKIIELVGISTKGLQDAVESAVKEASKTIRNMKGIDILSWTAKVEDDKIVEYRANVKISFVVEGER
jgi:flavin-binding protein dodecin